MNCREPVILVESICPPVPSRRFDWCAWIEGTEDAGPYGYGVTEEMAIEDLKRWLEGD